MKKTSLILLLSLLAIPAIFGQDKDEELISWKEGERLTWKDYKARPESGSGAAASTATYLSISYNITSNGFGYKILSQFSKTKSWGLYKTDYILSHEQGHFDIAEIFARKLNKEMSLYQFNKHTYQKDLQKIYNSILEEKEEMQNEYDRQTRHSVDKDQQASWLQYIKNQLTEYKDYAAY
jgi:hypothetical protein